MDRRISKKIWQRIIILCIIFSFIISFPIAPIIDAGDISPQSEDYTEFEFIPNYEKIYLLDNPIVNISLYVTIQNNVTIDTVGTDLITFTPTVLQCREITWGNLFGNALIRIDGVIDNDAGTIRNMVWGTTMQTNVSGFYANFSFDVISKGYGSVNMDAETTTVWFEMSGLPRQITHNFTVFSTPIIVTNEFPDNRSGGNEHNLLMNIDINHTLGDRMDMYWRSNATGAWKIIGIDNNLPNGTYDMSCYGVIESPYNQTLNYTCTDYYSSIFHSNTYPMRDLGNIIQVRIYTPGYSGTVKPIFSGRNGETYTVPTNKYTDITEDDYAPTEWKWTDIRDLDVNKSSSSPTYIIINYNLGFGDGVRVDWGVNVTDGDIWENITYWYVTEIESPIITDIQPYDSEVWLSYYPTFSANISDPNGDDMNISFFYQNETGYWIQIGTTQTGGNDTYSQPTTLGEYNTTVYWRIVATDEHNHTADQVFRFTFREIQQPPIDFTANTICSEAINLTWTKSNYTDNTRIQRRPDRFPNSVTDGLEIYNGTGNEFIDTDVNPGTIYFYSAWSWNNTDKTWSSENSSANEVTAPLEPYNLHATTTGYDSISLTWLMGEGSKSTLIRRSSSTYPTDQGDGDFVYEGNGTFYNDTGLGANITYYYSAWSHYFGAILEPRYHNDLPYTSFCSASLNEHGWCYQDVTIPAGESMYMTKLSWNSRGYLPSGGDHYRCTMYIYGEEFGWLSLHSYSDLISGWNDITVSDLYLQGGHTYTLGLYGWHTCSPHCAYGPSVTWNTNAEGKIYEMYGYYGYYSCLSDTDYNTTQVGPPSVTTLPASSIEDITATINGYLEADGGESTTCGFIWENESGSHNTTIGLYTKEQSFYLDIEGLLKGTTYHFQSWAINEYGFVTGDELTFNTKPVEPTDLTITDIGYNHINLSWTKGTGADLTSVRMKQGGYPTNPLDGSSVYFNGDNWTVATSLSSNSTYFFRAWSYNNTQSFYSTEYDETTGTTLVGLPVVTNNYPALIQDINATLYATLTDGNGESCTVGFRWGSSPGVYTNNATVGSYTTGQSFTKLITGLSKGNTYYYQSWAKNTGGFSNDTEDSFATKPVEPTGMTANNYGARQINITWTKGLGTDLTQIQRKNGSYPTSVVDGTTIYDGNSSNYLDVPLDENTTWFYRAWSYNNTNSLYSTLYASATDTTGLLPNISISPCGVTNMNRPPVTLSITGTGNSPLTYRWYSAIGESNRMLGDWASGPGASGDRYYSYGWFDSPPAYGSFEGGWYGMTHDIDNCLNYNSSDRTIVVWSQTSTYGAWSYSPALTIGLNEPTMVTGVNLSYSTYWASWVSKKVIVSYHDYYADVWHELTISGEPTEFMFTAPTVIDKITATWAIAGPHDIYGVGVNLDWIALYKPPDELYNTTANSGELKTYDWYDALLDGYTYWWLGSVSDGIDTVYEYCSFTNEGMEFTNEQPSDGETVYNTPSHTCSVQIAHTGGDTMDVYFHYKNITSGLYILGGQNLSVGNGIYQWAYPDSGQLSTTYSWNVSAWDGWDWHNETYEFIVRDLFIPSPPTYTLNNYNATAINITSISGDSKTDSILMRVKLGSYPGSRTDGDLVFNSTPSSFLHGNLIPNTQYFYSAWSWNQTDSVWSSVTQHSLTTLGPQPPSFNLAKHNKSVIHITGIAFNDVYSDTILIRAKIGSYPTDRSDGLFVVNVTGSSFDHTGLIQASYYYYSAWAYDIQTHTWSQPTNHAQRTNGPSTVYGISPYDGETIANVNPLMHFVVDEYNDEDQINIYWRSNYSGPWTTINSQLTDYEGHKYYQSSQFYYQDYKYWWSINVTDGEFWTNQTLTFTTGSMYVPTIIPVTYNTTQVNISWTKAPGTTHTWIQRKLNDYPASRTDGTNIYFGTGASCIDSGLSTAELYRYRVWSFNSTLGVYSASSTTAQALTKPDGPVNFTSIKTGYRTIHLSWIKGEGSQKTVIRYKPDNFPANYSDGILIYNDVGVECNATDLMPDDYLNYHFLLPGDDNFGVYIGGGDPFNNSCDNNEITKWDLNRSKTGNFSYLLGLEPQRVKGFKLLFKDFYNEPGADWNSAITKFEVYNGTWYTEWTGEKYNSGIEAEWWTYESEGVYNNVTQIRFNAWTEFITPDIYEVYVGKLGYVHCFKAFGYVTKGGLEQYSDGFDETSNRTDDTPPNTVPEITLNYPTNGSIGIDRNPLLNITISDAEGQLMNISWQYLFNGSWTELYQTTLVVNGTYTYSPSVFNNLTTVYYWRVNVSDTADVEYSAIYTNYNISPMWHFTTRDPYVPLQPSSFDATEYGAHMINITWAYGLNSDKIYIERNLTSTWTRGQGIFRYNGTGTFYQDAGLDDNTTYYYQAWGVNSTDGTISVLCASDDATTEYSPNDPPNEPYNPSPTNNTAYRTVYGVWLNCTVSDPNADAMDVSFYWGNDTLIGTIYAVANGSTASLYLPSYWHRYILGYECTWVTHDTTHYWYAVADDSEYQTQSPIWNFHTGKAWDLNIDRFMNSGDISILVSHYALRVIPPGASSWDIDENSYTNSGDVSSLVSHYGQHY